MHIHGYNAEIALQIGGSQYVNMTDNELKQLVYSNLTKKSCRPLKDVISVPEPGVAIMQFKADNPGNKRTIYNSLISLSIYSI